MSRSLAIILAVVLVLLASWFLFMGNDAADGTMPVEQAAPTTGN